MSSLPSPHAVRAGLLRLSVVLTGVLLSASLIGCDDDLYDSGTCHVSEQPNGQAKVECENGDALTIGDVIPDGICQMHAQQDGSSILRCEGDDYVIPAPKQAESYTCSLGETNGSETVRCRELLRPTPSCPVGLSGFMMLGDPEWGDGPQSDFGTKDAFLRYGCTSFTGSIRVSGPLKESDREVLQRLETLNGHIEIDEVDEPIVELASLRDGNPSIKLRYNATLKELRLPKLVATKELDVYANAALEVIYAPLLESVDVRFRIVNAPSLHTLSFDELAEADLEFTELGSTFETFFFPALQSSKITIQGAVFPSGMSFPSLETTSDLKLQYNTFTGRVAFPKLVEADELRVQFNDGVFALGLSDLVTAIAVLVENNDELQAVELQKLARVHLYGGLTIAHNPALESFSAPVFTGDGRVLILRNSALVSVRFDALVSQAVFHIEELVSLTTLYVPELRHVETDLRILGNTALDQCDVDFLVDTQLDQVPSDPDKMDITPNSPGGCAP